MLNGFRRNFRILNRVRKSLTEKSGAQKIRCREDKTNDKREIAISSAKNPKSVLPVSQKKNATALDSVPHQRMKICHPDE